MAISTSPEHYDVDSSDLRYLIARLAEKRLVLISVTVLSTLLFVTVALTTRPVYRATALLVPASGDRNNMNGVLNSALGQFGGIAALAGIGTGAGDLETEEALAVLRSRQFTEQFIDEVKLMPVLFESRWDRAAKDWRPSDNGPPTKAMAYKRFNDIRNIIQDKKTGLISLQIDWTDRTQAAAWANELVDRLNAVMRARAIRQADTSLSYLEKELEATGTIATREAISRLIEAQIKQRMLANVTQEYAFRVVDRAIAPDASDPVRPKKLLLFLLGPFVGFALAVVGILAFELFSGKRPRAGG